MSASAPRDTDREDFARGFARFARALCAGEEPRRRAGVCSQVTAALREALAAQAPGANGLQNLGLQNLNHTEWACGGHAARLAIYRSIVGAFLRNSGPGSPPSPKCPAGRPRPSRASAVARLATVTEAGLAAAALGRLEPMERAALLLVAVERLSYRDAAHALDTGEADFIATLARARSAFSARLAASAATGTPHLRLVR